MMDIFVNFLSAYERLDGSYEYSLRKIATNYITGFFWIDFLAIIPADLLMELNDHNVDSNAANT